MSNWKYKMNVSDFYHADMPVEQKGKLMAKRIIHTFPAAWTDIRDDEYDYDLGDIVDAFENITGYDRVTPTEEFDQWMSALHDFADLEVEPYGEWPRNKMCWIQTR